MALLAACGDDSGSSSATTSALPPVAVASSDNEYTPRDVTVQVGQPVVWTNTGRNQHNIVPGEGSPPADGFGITLEKFTPGGGTYTYAFSAPGTYSYYCSIHGTKKGKGMAGTVTVTG